MTNENTFEQMAMKSENIGKNLKEILCFLGMSQKQLAKKTKLTQAAISQIINGEREPSLKSIIVILIALNITFERITK